MNCNVYNMRKSELYEKMANGREERNESKPEV